MSGLSFSLSPEATAKVHGLLICLAKFGEQVSLEARGDKLIFAALNSSRTSYASFSLDPKTFFLSYNFGFGAGARFPCQLYNKALLSVFKGRIFDPRGGDTSIDRCDVSVEDRPNKVQCRIIVKMVCKHGVTKTYRLTYESVEVSHALFDRNAAPHGWTISSRILRSYTEYFGAKTEQLDLLAKDGKAVFTSFTEKIMDGKEVLKQPLETAIALHIQDFEDFHAQEDMHVVITVKDFKAIVTHAETLKTSITAHFSSPGRPLQFAYTDNKGLTCEFVLMTTGDSRPDPQSTAPKLASTRPTPRQPSMTSSHQTSSMFNQPSQQLSVATHQTTPRQESLAPAQIVDGTSMAPPPKPVSVTGLRGKNGLSNIGRHISQATTTSDAGDDSLFMPLGEDDERRWDPPNFEEAEEEMLGWDVNADVTGGFHPTFRDTENNAPPALSQSLNAGGTQGLPPTQRLSQMHGLFD